MWLPSALCSGYASRCCFTADSHMTRRAQPRRVFLQELERTSDGAVPKPRCRNAAVERRLRRVQDRAHTQPVTSLEVVHASRYRRLEGQQIKKSTASFFCSSSDSPQSPLLLSVFGGSVSKHMNCDWGATATSRVVPPAECTSARGGTL